jgi:hypothetical protein
LESDPLGRRGLLAELAKEGELAKKGLQLKEAQLKEAQLKEAQIRPKEI